MTVGGPEVEAEVEVEVEGEAERADCGVQTVRSFDSSCRRASLDAIFCLSIATALVWVYMCVGRREGG